MRIRVIDPGGKELGVGRDIETIKRQLKGRAEKSFAALPTPEFERDGVKDWDFGDLPEQVEFERNRIKLKGYPALAAQQDGSLALRLLDSPAVAERTFRKGLRRLIALQLQDRIRYLKRNLPHLQPMGLHFIRVGTQEELREDLLAAIIERAFLGDDPLPRTRREFDACLARGKARLMPTANEICATVSQALAAYHEIGKSLGDTRAGWLGAATDVREQLDHLVYKGFVTATPYEWLRHVPRYLKAIQSRLQKLKQAPDRDRQRSGEIGWLWEKYKGQADKNDAKGVYDPELERFRWMLEELRVSLFAQELRTAFPVSVKRLEAQWERVGFKF
jgi:ATP-dependent helicase HrpA